MCSIRFLRELLINNLVETIPDYNTKKINNNNNNIQIYNTIEIPSSKEEKNLFLLIPHCPTHKNVGNDSPILTTKKQKNSYFNSGPFNANY